MASDTRNLAFGVSVEAVEQFQVETAGAKSEHTHCRRADGGF